MILPGVAILLASLHAEPPAIDERVCMHRRQSISGAFSLWSDDSEVIRLRATCRRCQQVTWCQRQVVPGPASCLACEHPDVLPCVVSEEGD